MRRFALILALLAYPTLAAAQGFVTPAQVPAVTEGCVYQYTSGSPICATTLPPGMGGGVSQPLSDALGLIANGTDPSKVLKFNLAGLTTATQYTWTIPATNLTIPSSFLTLPFPDTAIILADATDPTKRVRFELGAISTGTDRVITVPDMDVTLGSGGGGGATLSSNTFTGDQTIAKNTPLLIMQDTSSGLGSASVATIYMKDSSGANLLQLGNTSSGYVRFKALQGGLTLEDATGGGIYINGSGVATFTNVPIWSSGLGAVSGTTGYFSGSLRSTGTLSADFAMQAGAVAVGSLPTPVEGMMIAVTDSSTAVWGATITGGGANHVLAYYNGTNWTVAAK